MNLETMRARFPTRFIPSKGISAVVMVVVILLILKLIWIAIPYEQIPRVDQTLDGIRVYNFASISNFVFVPAVFLMIGVFSAVVFAVVFVVRETIRRLRNPPVRIERYTPSGSLLQRTMRCVAYFGYAVCLLALFGLCLVVSFVEPYKDIRVIEVGAKTVKFRSLVTSWTVPRARIARVDAVQSARQTRGGNRVRNLYAVIHVRGGRQFRTPLQTFQATDVISVDHYLEFIELMKADLLK